MKKEKAPLFILSNLAISIDGKIGTQERTITHLGTAYDRKMMNTLRKKSDAILFGASTLRSFRQPCTVTGRKAQPLNVVISSRLEGISPDWPFFRSPKIARVLLVGSDASAKRVAEFAKTCRIITLQRGLATSRQAIAELKRLGVKRLLVEGGGSIMWEFVKEGLIDEFHVTLTPKLIGGTESPTLIDGRGFAPDRIPKLKLQAVRRVGDELYLTYRR